MPKLPILSASDAIKVLLRCGFGISRQRGSHIVLIKFVGGRKRIVVVPNHRELDPGTTMSIIEQSGMTKEEFLDRL
jgi:predicted RNA binding protein YcfA (HicA-like mRNA interferase family)